MYFISEFFFINSKDSDINFIHQRKIKVVKEVPYVNKS